MHMSIPARNSQMRTVISRRAGKLPCQHAASLMSRNCNHLSFAKFEPLNLFLQQFHHKTWRNNTRASDSRLSQLISRRKCLESCKFRIRMSLLNVRYRNPSPWKFCVTKPVSYPYVSELRAWETATQMQYSMQRDLKPIISKVKSNTIAAGTDATFFATNVRTGAQRVKGREIMR
jgi:hypothetical protein